LSLRKRSVINFFGRAFAQVKLELTQRLETRSLFEDWGEKLIFLCRAFAQVKLEFTQA